MSVETSVVSFTRTGMPITDQVVNLVGAVHVADRPYFDQLNLLFEPYDFVLYELVAPKGTGVTKHSRTGDHPVSALPKTMKSVLSLSY